MATFKKRSRRNIRGRQNLDNDETGAGEESEVIAVTATQAAVKPRSDAQQKKGKDASSVKPSTRGILSFEDELEEDDCDSEMFQIKKTARSQRLAREHEKEKKRREEKEKRRAEKEAKRVNASQEGSSDEEEVVPLGERLNAGYLPDASMIHAIRKRREMARKLGVDYLPLDSSNSHDHPSTAKGSSRLVREDEHDKSDDDGEEDDTPGTLTFGSRKEPGRQMQVLTALENVASDSEDDETLRWEEEQINKGMKASTQPGEPSHQYGYTDQYHHAPSSYHPHYGVTSTGAPPTYSQYVDPFAPPPNIRPTSTTTQLPTKLVPITMETLLSKLRRQLSDLEEDERSKSMRLRQVEEDLDAAQDTIEEIEREQPLHEREYHFFQQMRGYLRDLLSCLNEKAPAITQLAQRAMEVYHQRAALLTERRRQDMRDESEECTVPNGGGPGTKHGPDGDSRQRRAVEREARRRRRRERRERESVGHHHDGQSSDDEILETDRLKFTEDMYKVLVDVESIFSDVLEEFYDLATIKQRLEEWKFGYSDSYKHAFISLWLPNLFAPFVSLQLLQWNPLEEQCAALESMSWYELLMFYGFKEGEEPRADDEDLNLIPKLVDKVVIPRLTEFVERVWDPLSTKEGSRLIALIKALQEDYPTNSDNTQALLSAVVRRFKAAISDDVYIPLMTRVQLEVTVSTPKIIFYNRQFWTAVKLLGNITRWEGLLSSQSVQQLSVDGLLNRYLLLSLQNCPISNHTVERTSIVVSSLPQCWFTPPQDHTLTKSLQSLQRYLTHLAESLPTHSRQQLTDVLGMMVTVGAHQAAITIATEHNLSLTTPIR